MEVEWSEEKRMAKQRKHGVDLLQAARIFNRPTLTERDGRFEYGEIRHRSVGFVGEECYVLIWTQRGENRRLISAWKGGRDDRRRYQAGNLG